MSFDPDGLSREGESYGGGRRVIWRVNSIAIDAEGEGLLVAVATMFVVTVEEEDCFEGRGMRKVIAIEIRFFNLSNPSKKETIYHQPVASDDSFRLCDLRYSSAVITRRLVRTPRSPIYLRRNNAPPLFAQGK